MRKGSWFSGNGSSVALWVVLPLLAAPAWAVDPPAEQVWSDSLQGETYADHAVALGNHGTQVFTDSGTFSRYTRLYSCVLGPDPLVLWENSTSGYVYEHKVDAAEETGASVACYQRKTVDNKREVHIDFFDATSSTPLWSYLFPETSWGGDVGRCKITPDGDWIVAAAKGSNVLHVVVFEATSSGVPHRDFQLPFSGEISAFEISDDGSRLYMANGSYGHVYDLDTGASLFYKLLFGAESWGHAFSADGLTLVYLKDASYRVYRDQGSGYSEIATFQPYAYGSTDLAYIAALSKDGNTLAATGYDGAGLLTAYVLAWDVLSGTELLSDSVQGAGSYQNLPSDVAITPDGSRIAVGLWGDEAGLVPEILVYERAPAAGPFALFASFNRPGSVHQIDLSANGKKLATSGRDVHANQPSGNKMVEMYDLGSDLRVNGVPRTNAVEGVDFTFFPPSGAAAAFLVEAGSLSDYPRTFGIGTLYITRPRIRHPMVMNGGIATLNYMVTYSPGDTHYFQGYSLPLVTLSEDWVQVTALP